MPTPTPPNTLTDQVRARTYSLMQWAGSTAHKAGLHPDAITIAGLVLVAAASVFIAQGQMLIGGVLLLLSLPLDALDGAVARAMQRKDQFGALLDSALDRYADAFIFAGLSYYFAVQDRFDLMLLSLAALLGSFAVSYVRARGEGLGISIKIGWFSRMERVAIILLMMFVPPLMPVGLWVLAIGTNLTGVQRIWYAYRHLKHPDDTEL
jgi:CDP-diacylglycerol---glycerol-3-phosphate 3-phosphatidyltransferase